MLFNYNSGYQGKAVFITEGVFDTMKLVEWGYNSLSLQGASGITYRQLFLLTQLKPAKIILCLDNDEAGIKCSFKVMNKLEKYFKTYNMRLNMDRNIDEITREEFKRNLIDNKKQLLVDNRLTISNDKALKEKVLDNKNVVL